MNRKFFLGTMGGERRPPLDPEDLLVRLKKSTLYQGGNKPTGFRMILEWEAQKDLERYLQAEKFRVLLGSLEVLCQDAQIRYSSPLEKGAKAGGQAH